MKSKQRQIREALSALRNEINAVQRDGPWARFTASNVRIKGNAIACIFEARLLAYTGMRRTEYVGPAPFVSDRFLSDVNDLERTVLVARINERSFVVTTRLQS